MSNLLEFNPELDREFYAAQFAGSRRVRVDNVLTAESAAALREIVENRTPWQLIWYAGGEHSVSSDKLSKLTRAEMAEIERAVIAAGRSNEFCYLYLSYPLDVAFVNKWHPGSVQEKLRDELRAEPFAELLRDVTGKSEIVGADGYLTHYAPGHFLSLHPDQGTKWPRIVAYVLNLTLREWQPDYGGYLTFFDEKGDVDGAFKPKFNSLNIFEVPRDHCVTRISSFAPMGRAAISGWARATLYPPTT
jgi:Rps23 Pro-64 3,4-dihydroxylase Tpa1-like proline 4-hydroxylase